VSDQAAGAPSTPPETEITYRYMAGDDPLMAEVATLCYETLHAPFGVSRNDDWDNMDPASTHLVALAEGHVVGYARLIIERDWGHIRQLAVYPEWRGRGIGSRLVQILVALSRYIGLRGVYLNARLAAVSLYRRQGFKQVGGEFRMPRTYLQHVRMEMEL
jgi:N-acetylglutamate synthase-like GNAT family acetyltransferase